jgi:serine/threonine protein phosphatase PrpC
MRRVKPRQPYDLLLVCSDGLTEGLSLDLLAQCINHLDKHQCCFIDYPRLLVDAAISKGATDNITAVVYRHPGHEVPEIVTTNYFVAKATASVLRHDAPLV